MDEVPVAVPDACDVELGEVLVTVTVPVGDEAADVGIGVPVMGPAGP